MQRRNMTTVRNVGIAVVLMVCLGFLYMYHGLSTKLYETESTHERCKRNIESLNSQVQDLMSTFETQRKKTDNDRADLVNRAKKSEQQYKNVQSQHDDIKHSFETLSQTHKKALEDHSQLESRNAEEYNLLKTEKDIEISGLKDKIANLERDKDKLLRDQESVKLQLQDSQAKVADDAVLLGTMRDQNAELKQLNAQLQSDISQHKAAEQGIHIPDRGDNKQEVVMPHPDANNNAVNHMKQIPENIPKKIEPDAEGPKVDVGEVPGVPKQMKPPLPDSKVGIGYKEDDNKNKSKIDNGDLNHANPLDDEAHKQIEMPVIQNKENNIDRNVHEGADKDENKDQGLHNDAVMQHLQVKEPNIEDLDKNSNLAGPGDKSKDNMVGQIPVPRNPGQPMDEDDILQAHLHDEDKDEAGNNDAADEDENYEDEEDEMEEEDGDRYEEEENVPHGGEN